MTETLASRILSRIEELEISIEKAATRSGLDRSTIRKIIEREGGARSDTITKLARGLQTTPEWLLSGAGQKQVQSQSRASEAVPAPTSPQPPAPHAPSRYLPVYGLAAGSVTGVLTMTNDPIEEVASPEVLARVRDAYALIVTGTSMEPRYFAGDYVFVHPHKPIRQGDHVVIQELRDGGTVVSIKRFDAMTESHVVTQQYNPLAEIKFLRAQVAAMHRVLTPNEVAGV